ncbi:hypothetical protein MRX96_002272 [Rhipicephalus microplus]
MRRGSPVPTQKKDGASVSDSSLVETSLGEDTQRRDGALLFCTFVWRPHETTQRHLSKGGSVIATGEETCLFDTFRHSLVQLFPDVTAHWGELCLTVSPEPV